MNQSQEILMEKLGAGVVSKFKKWWNLPSRTEALGQKSLSKAESFAGGKREYKSFKDLLKGTLSGLRSISRAKKGKELLDQAKSIRSRRAIIGSLAGLGTVGGGALYSASGRKSRKS